MKKITVNFLILLILLGVIELFANFTLLKKYGLPDTNKEFVNIDAQKNATNFLTFTKDKKIKLNFFPYTKTGYINIFKTEKRMRPIEYKDKTLPPIWLMGCSFTYGYGIRENETFSHKLAEYTNRTVINRGIPGTSIPFVYNQLYDANILKSILKKSDNIPPQYIIYTFIPEHLERMCQSRTYVISSMRTIKYKLNKRGELVVDKIHFPALHSLSTGIIIDELVAEQRFKNKKKCI